MSTTLLHELSPQVRSNIIQECKRVLKKEGRILFIDFHPGPIRPIKGWLAKLLIIISEIAAGREHFKNYRRFIKNGGLFALVNSHDLSIDDKRVVTGGAMAVLLLKKT
jgi:demethylmenaquinone methyltransferase/2-methoxy-6-polyprenyl-1,4-benzoquinol methylase